MEDGVCGEVFTTDDHNEGFAYDEDEGFDDKWWCAEIVNKRN